MNQKTDTKVKNIIEIVFIFTSILLICQCNSASFKFWVIPTLLLMFLHKTKILHVPNEL